MQRGKMGEEKCRKIRAKIQQGKVIFFKKCMKKVY